METKKIRFLEDYTVDDYRKGTPDEEKYTGGKVYDLPLPSAEHFIRTLRAEAPGGKPASAPADEKTGDETSGPYRIVKDDSVGRGKPSFAVFGPVGDDGADGQVGELTNKKPATEEAARLNAEAAEHESET